MTSYDIASYLMLSAHFLNRSIACSACICVQTKENVDKW